MSFIRWLLLVVIPKLALVCVFGWVCFSCGRFDVVGLILAVSVTCSWYLGVFVFVDLWSGCRVVSFGLGLGCYNCLCRLGCCVCGVLAGYCCLCSGAVCVFLFGFDLFLVDDFAFVVMVVILGLCSLFS